MATVFVCGCTVVRVAGVRTLALYFISEWPGCGHSRSILYLSGRGADTRTLFYTRVAGVRTLAHLVNTHAL